MAVDPTHSAAGRRGLITVFGGTGFLGRRIVRHLLDHGFPVRAASRHPEWVGSASRPDAAPETTKADIRDETEVAAALFGAYGVINAVSLYAERGRETFDAVHVEAAARVARLARDPVRRASGAHSADSGYRLVSPGNITMGDRRARDKIPVILPEWMRGVGAAAYQLLKSREVAEDLGSCPPAI